MEYERTLLAWNRTPLALFAAVLAAMELLGHSASLGVRRLLAVPPAGVAVLVAAV